MEDLRGGNVRYYLMEELSLERIILVHKERESRKNMIRYIMSDSTRAVR